MQTEHREEVLLEDRSGRQTDAGDRLARRRTPCPRGEREAAKAATGAGEQLAACHGRACHAGVLVVLFGSLKRGGLAG